jgi:arylformamidase
MKPLKSRWIDISVPLRSGMVHWPGDPAVVIQRLQDMERGDRCNVSTLSLSAHTGTHMDAPLHFLPHSAGIDALPLEATIGPARVIEIADREAVKPTALRSHRIRRGERILFRTPNSDRCWGTDAFVEDYTYVTREAAEYLVERGVRTVGIDYLSVGGFHRDGAEVHRILLGAGVWIIEGLDLRRVRTGRYELICLPLRILGADGAPARAALRPRPSRKRLAHHS